jgi:hypothetical protein
MILKKTTSAILYNGNRVGYFRILSVYRQDPRVNRALKDFVRKVENNRNKFNSAFETVNNFNEKYTEYTEFVSRMLNMKIDMMRRCIL